MTSRIFRALVVSVTAMLGVAGCAFGDPPPDELGQPPQLPTPSGSPQPQTEVVAEVVAENLEVPWGIAFLPDETAVVTERDSARIVTVAPDGDVTEEQVIDGVNTDGEGGLLGIAASPDYAQDETLFIYYSTDDDNRIAALTLGSEPEPILTGIPHSDLHNGGQLAFGPDGYLYATTGDAGDGDHAQDRDDLGGKILRIDTDGEPAEDNPFDDSPVYSYGHRNPQGLAWDGEERLVAVEFGQNEYDEVNVIEPGGNYGWPEVEGTGGGSEYIDPVAVWAPEEASCSGAAFTDSTLVTACLRGQRLWLVEFAGNGSVMGTPEAAFQQEFGRLRASVAAPDGTLWVTTSNLDGRCDSDTDCQPADNDDKILRIITGASGEGLT